MKLQKTVYLSGQMTGVENLNFPEFNRVAALLRDQGYEVINPAEFETIKGWQWEDYMKRCIDELIKADIVAMLPDWTNSRGAALEVFIANNLKIPVVEYEKIL